MKRHSVSVAFATTIIADAEVIEVVMETAAVDTDRIAISSEAGIIDEDRAIDSIAMVSLMVDLHQPKPSREL
jgi:acyl carrier protein